MKDPLYVRVAYEWGNPYREPPDGKPRVLAEVFFRYAERPGPNQPIPEFDAVWKPGSGYNVTWTFISEPPKQKPAEKLAEIRKKRIRRRVEKKYPLFANQFVREEIEKNPEYYDGITRADIQEAKDRVVQRERERIDEIEKQISSKE